MSDEHVPDTRQHGSHYSEERFWDKIRGVALKLGSSGLYYALVLFYTLMDEDTPTSQKAVIIGALGYFILPLDLIPDLTPLLGFSDDIAALTAAFNAVKSSVKPKHLQQAKTQLKEWFPSANPPDLES